MKRFWTIAVFACTLGAASWSASFAAEPVNGIVYLPGTSAPEILCGDEVKTQFRDGLVIDFPAGKGYPAIQLSPEDGVWDFSACDALDFTIQNTGSKSGIVAGKIQNADDWRKHNTEQKRIEPGKTEVIRIRFGKSYGAAGDPLDLKNLAPVVVFAVAGEDPLQFTLQSVKAVKMPVTAAQYPKADGSLMTIQPGMDPGKIGGNHASVEVDGNALNVTTEADCYWPGVTLAAPDGSWDLSKHQYLALDLHSTDTRPFDLFVRIDNPGADGSKNCTTDRVGLQPDQRTTLTIPLKRRSSSPVNLFGMNGKPDGLYGSTGGIDPSNVVALVLFTEKKSPVGHSFKVSNLRVFGEYKPPRWATMKESEFFPFIDAFGQFLHKDWPGKTHSVADLKRNREEEAARLAADRGPENWNRYGGYAEGPTLKATGHFRTEKYQGKWFLVDPEGRLFFSTGVNVVDMNFGVTMTDRRDTWFKDFDALKSGDLSDFYFTFWDGKTKAFNFSGANLQRKYGADWRTIYPEIVHKRLRSWGINTIGNWSDRKIYLMKKTPYAVTLWYTSKRIGKANFPDVFDATFQQQLNKVMDHLKGSHKDPWCIGYFIDNEMPWGGSTTLAEYVLSSDPDQAAKQKFRDYLKEKYRETKTLNQAWGTSFESFENFLRQKTPPRTPAGIADLEAFTGIMAETYFRTVRDTIKRVAPNKLYLGCRCVGGSLNVISKAVKYCDVVSYNLYTASVKDVRIPGGFDAPVMIGEFHFGAMDRGLFWGGLFAVADQKQRAESYRKYLHGALKNPLIVGAHWFQYGDEATTGRYDGENAQCGFVDVADTPYRETVRAAREIGDTMYQYRLNSGGK